MYTKAYSQRFGNDPRLIEVRKFQKKNQRVVELVEEIARQAQVVEDTPFDYETQISNRLVNKQIQELKYLIELNPNITREYVLSTLNPIEESLNELHQKHLLQELKMLYTNLKQ